MDVSSYIVGFTMGLLACYVILIYRVKKRLELAQMLNDSTLKYLQLKQIALDNKQIQKINKDVTLYRQLQSDIIQSQLMSSIKYGKSVNSQILLDNIKKFDNMIRELGE
jgi:hypothetical protein